MSLVLLAHSLITQLSKLNSYIQIWTEKYEWSLFQLSVSTHNTPYSVSFDNLLAKAYAVDGSGPVE